MVRLRAVQGCDGQAGRRWLRRAVARIGLDDASNDIAFDELALAAGRWIGALLPTMSPKLCSPRILEPPHLGQRGVQLGRPSSRVHEVDVTQCTRCPGRRRVIAFITDAEVVTAILAHLGLPPRPPLVAPARAPPEAQLPFAGWSDTDFIDPPAGFNSLHPITMERHGLKPPPVSAR